MRLVEVSLEYLFLTMIMGFYKHFIIKDQILSETEILLDDRKVNFYTFELLTR
jgi:hypothetical protein